MKRSWRWIVALVLGIVLLAVGVFSPYLYTVSLDVAGGAGIPTQIGRASCRERVSPRV